MAKKPKAPKKSALERVAEGLNLTAECLVIATDQAKRECDSARNLAIAHSAAAGSAARRAEDAAKGAEDMLARASAEVAKLQPLMQSIAALLADEQFKNVGLLAGAVLECRASAQVCRDIRSDINKAASVKQEDQSFGGRFGIDDDDEVDA